MTRAIATAATMILVALSGCGSSTSAPAQPAGGSKVEQDTQDTRAIERQVNRQQKERYAGLTAGQGPGADATTVCTKESDTSYKCLTDFTYPAGRQAITNVTCDRNGGGCITEIRP